MVAPGDSSDPRAALPTDVRRTWDALATVLPPDLYLGGGSALVLRLHHRTSQDLDFFFHASTVDLGALEAKLAPLGFAVTNRAPGTLQGVLEGTKLEFLHADETRPQHVQAAPEPLAGINVASLQDLMAMKLKVLAERGELRDYYDVMVIDQRGGVSVEDGIAHWLDRYGLDRASGELKHLVRSLGYLDDVEDDEAVPMTRDDLTEWWRRRQVEVILNLG